MERGNTILPIARVYPTAIRPRPADSVDERRPTPSVRAMPFADAPTRGGVTWPQAALAIAGSATALGPLEIEIDPVAEIASEATGPAATKLDKTALAEEIDPEAIGRVATKLDRIAQAVTERDKTDLAAIEPGEETAPVVIAWDKTDLAEAVLAATTPSAA